MLISVLTFFKGARAEVGRTPSRPGGSKRMFCCLASRAHRLRRAIQPFLHRVEDGFVLPTLDAPLLRRRAFRFQPAGGAFRRPVVTQLQPCLDIVQRPTGEDSGSASHGAETSALEMIEITAQIKIKYVLQAEKANA
jgi:hypothetical protein